MSEIANTENVTPLLATPMPGVEWAAVRARRDQLLRSTDFTQLLDYPATDAQRAEVVAYRKALRDIPEQGGAPSMLEWPELPAFLK
ncbi:tail fiber assembly protein [Pseudomonas tolaasii]|nr:tail fiber assembly protein [Pseudomonas tolaasii]PKA75787.1 phage tail assembly chaperone [Pseudomonas tolaasii NCPPB 2192]WLH53114.1 tail fiber assembly protein [Pseudomonas tolaasii]